MMILFLYSKSSIAHLQTAIKDQQRGKDLRFQDLSYSLVGRILLKAVSSSVRMFIDLDRTRTHSAGQLICVGMHSNRHTACPGVAGVAAFKRTLIELF